MDTLLLSQLATGIILALGALIWHLRAWQAREARLDADTELVTLAAKLASGVTNAPGLFAQGHSKAVDLLRDEHIQLAYVVRREHAEDTQGTVTAYLRCPAQASGRVQSAYASYFPGGELAFFEVGEGDEGGRGDPFARMHAGLRAGREPSPLDRMRMWALQRLRMAA